MTAPESGRPFCGRGDYESDQGRRRRFGGSVCCTTLVAQPTNNLALAVTTAQSGGCKLSGDVKMVSQTLDVSKFEVPCRGNKKPMKITCRNDDCKRDWIQAYP